MVSKRFDDVENTKNMISMISTIRYFSIQELVCIVIE